MWALAVRKKVRFQIKGGGQISPEDLFDLPLTARNGRDLDSIAKSLFSNLKEDTISFVKPRSKSNSLDALRLDLVKYVIAVKLDEVEMAKRSTEKKAKQQQILGLIKDKQNDEMRGKSIEELQKEFDAL